MVESHRDALLDAARVLLRTKGLRATTARDLVAESGTNLASIGYHFGSKEALMTTALTGVFQEWTEQPVAAATAAAADGPGEALAAALREMLADLPARRPEILAFAEAMVAAGRESTADDGNANGGHAIGPMLAASSTRSLDAVAASMTAATPDMPAEAAQAAAAVLVCLHDGLALLSTTLPDRVPEPDLVIMVLIGLGAVLADGLGVDPAEIATTVRGGEG